MKPIDIRNATFASIQERLTADREKVWQGYRLHGPCTTRELADKIGMSLLTVRPRTTELYELGLVDCTGRGADGGIYEHVMLCVAQARWEARQAAESAGQLEMAFA